MVLSNVWLRSTSLQQLKVELELFKFIIKSFKNLEPQKSLRLISYYKTWIFNPAQNLACFLFCRHASLDPAAPGRRAHNSSCVCWADVFFSCTEEAQYPVPARALIPHWGTPAPSLSWAWVLLNIKPQALWDCDIWGVCLSVCLSVLPSLPVTVSVKAGTNESSARNGSHFGSHQISFRMLLRFYWKGILSRWVIVVHNNFSSQCSPRERHVLWDPCLPHQWLC